MGNNSFQCVEGQPFLVDRLTRDRIDSAVARLDSELHFRSFPLSYTGDGRMVIRGVIGAIALPDGRTMEVSPKVLPDEDWVRAVLHLLVGSDRIDVAGERAAGLAQERKSILPVLAAIYAYRLERALRRDGPIVLMKREHHVKPTLKGKLNATAWVRHGLKQPHLFPAESNVLTVDNDFARAFAVVADNLAAQRLPTSIRARLVMAQKALRPGFPLHTYVAPGVELRQIPSQWSIYRPAWAIASAILARRSLLGATGWRQGVSIAIEAWPLLERLLQRALISAASYYVPTKGDPVVKVPSKPNRRTLLTPSNPTEEHRRVDPDGCLEVNGAVRAVFDAKYKKRERSDWPSREDVYQVLTTAAAFGAPVAVLIYPEKFDAVAWEVKAAPGYPTKMVAIGLGLFSYRSGIGDRERGRVIIRTLVSLGCTPSPLCFAGIPIP